MFCLDGDGSAIMHMGAMAITGEMNGADLCDPDGDLWLEDAAPIEPANICLGPRVGLGQTPEPWLSIPWRYWIHENPYVS